MGFSSLSLSLSRCFSLPCLLPTKKNSISTDLRLLALSLFKVFFKLWLFLFAIFVREIEKLVNQCQGLLIIDSLF